MGPFAIVKALPQLPVLVCLLQGGGEGEGGGEDIPTQYMTDVVMPIDTASVSMKLAAIFATTALLGMFVVIAFWLARKLLGRTKRAV